MKKKLLITLGCSLTEGEGCYDYSNMDEMVPFHLLRPDLSKYQTARFHKYGWPNLLGKSLGFDKVLNLGLRGTSNQVHLNRFVGIITPQIKSLKENYDLYLVWFMTEPSRFSFSGPRNFFNVNPTQQRSEIEKAYLIDSVKHKFAPIKDQAFLMASSEIIFNSLGVKFIFCSWNRSFPEVYRYFESPNYLSPHPDYIRISSDPALFSKVCTHPNEEGYKFISNQIEELIRKFHPSFIVGDPKKHIAWEHISFYLDSTFLLKSLDKKFVI